MSETRWVKGQDGQWHEIGPDDRDWHFGVSESEKDRIQGIQFGQLCPCCSSDRIDIANGLRHCECGAVFTIRDDRLTLEQAVKIVNIRDFRETERDPEYFDFFIWYPDSTVTRVHGWYDTITKAVCQFG